MHFDFIAQHFPGRERNEIKRKFKVEEKKNPQYVDKMLRERKAFDATQLGLGDFPAFFLGRAKVL
jgi:hypothetical protein